MIFNAAVDDMILDRNPLQSTRLRFTNQQKKVREPLSAADMQRICDEIPLLEREEDRRFSGNPDLHGAASLRGAGVWTGADVDLCGPDLRFHIRIIVILLVICFIGSSSFAENRIAYLTDYYADCLDLSSDERVKLGKKSVGNGDIR